MILMLTAPCVSYRASSAAFFCLCDQSNTFWERCSILSASDDLGQIKPRKYYSPFSSELPLNFVANFPIHKISFNLFVIISKTSKIYNPFFVLLINGHFESMVEVSDSALPTYFPPSTNLLLLTAQLNWFSVSSSDTNFCLEVKEGWPDCQTS